MAGLKKILLVEDNPQILQMYSAVLTKYGYELTTSSTVDDALAQVKTFQPDVVLLDIMLPGDRTGLDALIVLHTDPAYGCTNKPIIMLTNLGLTDKLQKICEEYADGYVVKAEIVPHELPGIIESVTEDEKAT
jgi:CheY-like chemotaxis protein